MKYIVIGLGNFGKTISKELTGLGNDVIAVDSDSKRADSFKDEVATTYILDASVEEEIKCLPLQETDAVIVGIGSNFGAIIQVIALLKKNGVKHIYARAGNQSQVSILQMFNLDGIIEPENESGRIHALKIASNSYSHSIHLDSTHAIYSLVVSQEMEDLDLTISKLKSKYNLNLAALLKACKVRNILGLEVEEKLVQDIDDNYVFQKGDELKIIGKDKDFRLFIKDIS